MWVIRTKPKMMLIRKTKTCMRMKMKMKIKVRGPCEGVKVKVIVYMFFFCPSTGLNVLYERLYELNVDVLLLFLACLCCL